MRREFHVRFCESPGVQSPRATRLVIVFEHKEDADRVLQVLPQRLDRYGLRLNPEKTRLIPFRRPRDSDDGSAAHRPSTSSASPGTGAENIDGGI